MHFRKRAAKVSTALHCTTLRCTVFFCLFVCFSPLWPVAPLSGAWHLLQTDRIKAHSLSLLLGLRHHHHHQPSASLNTSQESSTELQLQSQHKLTRLIIVQLGRTSCSAPELPADGNTAPHLKSIRDSWVTNCWKETSVLLVGWMYEQPAAFCSPSSSRAEVSCVIAGG